MKTFNVTLTKSYIVKIQADNEINARECAEMFTGDIRSISTAQDEAEHKFKIEDIDCKTNEAIDSTEFYENN